MKKVSLILITLSLFYFGVNAQVTGSFKDSRDGKVYKTVKIGNQWWMAENLAYKVNKVNGDCWAYKNNSSNVSKYGYLYDWYTAKKVCPSGWHLPSGGEWIELIDYLEGDWIAGTKIRSISGWQPRKDKSYVTNKSGFTALPGGMYHGGGAFSGAGIEGVWWSSWENYYYATFFSLRYNRTRVHRKELHKSFGMSVRCIRDIIKIETGSFTDSRDGKVYKTVKIGNQWWMAENLAYKGNNDNQRHITDDDAWGSNKKYDGWCYYDNKESNGSKYGVLYQWNAAVHACPTGWHLPSDAEWTQLTDYLGGEDNAGKELKSKSGWKLYKGKNYGSNESGFAALPGGIRGYHGDSFGDVGGYGYWWSSSQNDASSGWKRDLDYYDAEVERGTLLKSYGFSVRCLRD